MIDDARLAEARERAKVRFEFYVHVFVYLAGIGVLLIVDLTTSPRSLRFIWPAMGWGIAIALHGAKAFLPSQKKNEIIDSPARRELDKRRGERHRSGRVAGRER